MIERLLELMRAGGTWRVEDLARALDTTPTLVEMMLEDLARRGYLKSLSDVCDARCSGCALAEQCTSNTLATGMVWTFSKDIKL